MISYLEKFKSLPPDVRQKISSEEVIKAINALEEEYKIKLATVIMRLLVKDFNISDLANVLADEFGLDFNKAEELAVKIKKNILSSVSYYILPNTEENKELPLEIAGETSEEFSEESLAELPSEVLKSENQEDEVEQSVNIETEEQLGEDIDENINDEEEFGFIEKDENEEGEEKQEVALEEPLKLSGEIDPSHLLPMEEKTKEEKEVISTVKEEEKKVITDNGNEKVKKIKSPISNLKSARERAEEIERKTREIVNEVKISFTSDDMKRRFEQIISTYLKGVRNKLNTKEIMMRPATVGGLGLDVSWADKIISIAVSKNESNGEEKDKINIRSTADGSKFIFNENEIKKSLVEKENTIKEIGASQASKTNLADSDYDLLTALKERAGAGKEISAKIEKVGQKEISKEEPKKAFEVSKFKKDSVLGNSFVKELPEENKKREIYRGSANGKVKMDDIRLPQTMSPIDELAYMDLLSFRRMDVDIKRRTKKIEEKINLLSKDGIDKKIAGINAWRGSPVVRTYLQIGEESIGNGKPVEEIIKIRKDKKLNYLEVEEFEAIMDLNRKLRF